MRGKPEETRRRILTAATALFYTQGIRAVGVDLIASEAGVTKRTLYRHYESKNALVVAYLEDQNEPVLAALVKSVMRVPRGITEQIEGLFTTFARQAGNSAWHGCPFARAVFELREFENDVVSRTAANHKHTFEEWLESHLASNNVDESDLLARQIIVLVDGCITQLLIHRDPSYATAAAGAAVTLIRQRLPE